MKPLQIITLWLASLLSVWGCSPKVYPVETVMRDSVIIREEVKYHDSIVVRTLPAEMSANTTRDTSSRLETSAAISTATVSGGILRHEIWNKSVPMHFPIKIPEIKLTTERMSNNVTTLVREVNVLTRWQKILQALGWMMLALMLYFLLKMSVKLLKHF